MAFLKIKSDNLNLSWVLEKNPETGIISKGNRSGFLFGFFPNKNPKEYCIYFKDKSDEISYKKDKGEQFEYLSATKYNDARFINDAFQEILHSARENLHLYLVEHWVFQAFKGPEEEPYERKAFTNHDELRKFIVEHELKEKEKFPLYYSTYERVESEGDYDVPSIHSMTVNLINTDYKTVDIFQRYFTEIEIKASPVLKDNYKITFTTLKPCTLSLFLNLINLFGIFATLNSDSYIYLDESLIGKYIKILNRLDAPYFIRYLLKVKMLRAEKKFSIFKPELEKTEKYKIDFTYGDTHDARIMFIKDNLPLTLPIVDIGTGIDYRYIKKFAAKLQDEGIPYYAIESDFDARERIKAGVKNRGWANVEVFESIQDFMVEYEEVLGKPKVNIICTEVLEHNSTTNAAAIMRLINEINYSKLIVTMPNSEFNKYYGLENFRHADHKWEPSKVEFEKFITENSSETIQFYYVGDKVDGIGVSHGAILLNNRK